MTDLSTESPRRREPMFNAPVVVVGTATLLIVLFAIYFFASVDEKRFVLEQFALDPARFWAPAGSTGPQGVYDSHAAGLLTLVSTALLHGDWMHVIVNALMVLMFGTPVARALGTGFAGAGKWMLLFVVSIVAGSALYLAMTDVTSYPAVGASGGTSGLIAAAFLLDQDGRRRPLWSRDFLMLTVVFAVLNGILTLLGPYILGMGLAWQAHVGGYIAGALLMAILPLRGYRAAKA